MPIPDALDPAQSLSNSRHDVLPNPRHPSTPPHPHFPPKITAKLNKHITHERGLIQCQVGKSLWARRTRTLRRSQVLTMQQTLCPHQQTRRTDFTLIVLIERNVGRVHNSHCLLLVHTIALFIGSTGAKALSRRYSAGQLSSNAKQRGMCCCCCCWQNTETLLSYNSSCLSSIVCFTFYNINKLTFHFHVTRNTSVSNRVGVCSSRNV